MAYSVSSPTSRSRMATLFATVRNFGFVQILLAVRRRRRDAPAPPPHPAGEPAVCGVVFSDSARMRKRVCFHVHVPFLCRELSKSYPIYGFHSLASERSLKVTDPRRGWPSPGSPRTGIPSIPAPHENADQERHGRHAGRLLPDHAADRGHPDRRHRSGRADHGGRDHRRDGPVPAARRDRRPRPFPRTGTHAQGGPPARDARLCQGRRHHVLRHAQHAARHGDQPICWTRSWHWPPRAAS